MRLDFRRVDARREDIRPEIGLCDVCEARPAGEVGIREIVQSHLNRGKIRKSLRMDEKNKIFNRKTQIARLPQESDRSRVLIISAPVACSLLLAFSPSELPSQSTVSPSRQKRLQDFTPIAMAVAVESLKPAGNGYLMRQRGVSCMAMVMVDHSATVNTSRGDPPSPPPNPPPSPSRTCSVE